MIDPSPEQIAARIAKDAVSGTKPEGQIEFEILELLRLTRVHLAAWQPIAAKLVKEWGTGIIEHPGDELPEDWFMRMLTLLREVASPPLAEEGARRPPPLVEEKDSESRGGSVPGTPHGDLPRRATGDK